jgi:anaphase-promoting complex subunit 3
MSWAMDLDPKGVNNQLKESIDKRYVVDSDSTFARELETINTCKKILVKNTLTDP